MKKNDIRLPEFITDEYCMRADACMLSSGEEQMHGQGVATPDGGYAYNVSEFASNAPGAENNVTIV